MPSKKLIEKLAHATDMVVIAQNYLECSIRGSIADHDEAVKMLSQKQKELLEVCKKISMKHYTESVFDYSDFSMSELRNALRDEAEVDLKVDDGEDGRF